MKITRVMRIVTRMNLGGPAVQIAGLTKNLSQEEFEQILITGHCDNSERDFLIAHNLRISQIEIPELGRRVRPLSDIAAFFKIRKLIRDFQPDIVHTHMTKAGLIGRIAAYSISPRIKLVHTFHGHLLQGYFGFLKTQAVILVESTLARISTTLVAVGHNVKRDLVKKRIGTLEKFRVVFPGVELTEIPHRSQACVDLNTTDQIFRITWIGRAVPVKAPNRILSLAEKAKELGLPFNFTIVGDGPMLDQLKSESSVSKSNISFLGWQQDIEAVLAISDLVILTSLNEGTPISIIQSQLAGVPVLATDVGSTKETILSEVTGYCLPYNLESFLEKIIYLYDNPEFRLQMGRNGQQFCRNQFSVKKMTQSYEEIYRSII